MPLGEVTAKEARKKERGQSRESSRSRGREAGRRAVLSRKARALSAGKRGRGSAKGSAHSGKSARKDKDPDASWDVAALGNQENSIQSIKEVDEGELGDGLLGIPEPDRMGPRARTQIRRKELGIVDSENESARSGGSARSRAASGASFREAREADRETVTFEALVAFLHAELGISSKDEFRLRELLDVILIRGQGVEDRDKISRRAALRAFSEKIDIQLPLHQFFHIGINAAIDHENAEDCWHEKVFNFYQ